jgi:hypothetical protein
MRTLAAIIGYLAITCLIILGASESARWLVAPDLAVATSAQPVARQIPPRIADSLERKKVLVREAAPAPAPAEIEPVMREAPVSLPTTQQIRINEVRAPKSRRHQPKPRVKPLVRPDDSRRTIATPIGGGRSDNPYD